MKISRSHPLLTLLTVMACFALALTEAKAGDGAEADVPKTEKLRKGESLIRDFVADADEYGVELATTVPRVANVPEKRRLIWTMLWSAAEASAGSGATSAAAADVRLECFIGNTWEFEAEGKRYIEIAVAVRHPGAVWQVVDTQKVTKGVALQKGHNTLSVSYASGRMEVAMGEDYLYNVCSVELPGAGGAEQGPASCYRFKDVMLTAGADLKIDCFTASSASELDLLPATVWTLPEIEQYLAAAPAGVAGRWEALDRDLDTSLAKSGGTYSLAVVPRKSPSDSSSLAVAAVPAHGLKVIPGAPATGTIAYEIIYLGGAKVYGSHWMPGMVKGYLYSTPFENHYNLVWFDAQKLSMGPDLFAAFTPPSILTLRFPLHNSTLRFAKP